MSLAFPIKNHFNTLTCQYILCKIYKTSTQIKLKCVLLSAGEPPASLRDSSDPWIADHTIFNNVIDRAI